VGAFSVVSKYLHGVLDGAERVVVIEVLGVFRCMAVIPKGTDEHTKQKHKDTQSRRPVRKTKTYHVYISIHSTSKQDSLYGHYIVMLQREPCYNIFANTV
jgi:hypothetical protein